MKIVKINDLEIMQLSDANYFKGDSIPTYNFEMNRQQKIEKSVWMRNETEVCS